MGAPARFRPRLFTRAAPVLAMAVLVVNDHLLKGSGWVPGWLTGKLSDFAGVYFAPLLLAEVWLLASPASSPPGAVRRLGVSVLLSGAGFAAVKTLPAASEAYLEGLRWLSGAIGLRHANVVDPTDLLALAMAPAAYLSGRRWCVTHRNRGGPSDRAPACGGSRRSTPSGVGSSGPP